MKNGLAIAAAMVAVSSMASPQELTGANVQYTTSGNKYVLAQRQLKTWGELSLDFLGGYQLSKGNPEYAGLGAFYKFTKVGSSYASLGLFAVGSDKSRPDFGFSFSVGFEF